MNGKVVQVAKKVPVAPWRDIVKMHSMYFLGALAFVPDVLEYMVSSGYITPGESGIWFKVAVGVTAAARIYQRRKAAEAPAEAPQ